MPWDEFQDLLAGLLPDTPLGRIVSIRTEDDAEVLKTFTPEQKKIRSDWQKRTAKNKSAEDLNTFLDSIKNMFTEG